MTKDTQQIEQLLAGVLQGDRRSLAKAITLVESHSDGDQQSASDLMDAVLPYCGKAVRLGISGSPGVGKSTLIESLGIFLIGLGKRVAVLAIDPTSPKTKGSILGDKTRMQKLSNHERAYVRPSPSGGTLGGVAQKTREAMLLCEAAGFDVILVETVGVGQSETAVAQMVDSFLLLLQPAAGDELQGLKKGVLELADIVAVNKADGALLSEAERTKAEYARALSLIRHSHESAWRVPVIAISGLHKFGLAELWQQIEKHLASLKLPQKRASQAEYWLWNAIEEGLVARFRSNSSTKGPLADAVKKVQAGELSVSHAARHLLSQA